MATEINPLLIILSPRDIPDSIKSFDSINYVDKLWIKYFDEVNAHRIAYEYFMQHKEYTHLILESGDDAVIPYDAIALLLSDLKKYDFPVLAGCCCYDKRIGNMRLPISIESQEFGEEASPFGGKPDSTYPKQILTLPYRVRFLNKIIEVSYHGNTLGIYRRDVLEKINFRSWNDRGCCTDFNIAYQLWKLKIPMYVDLRCYADHYKYSLSSGIGKSYVGVKSAHIEFVKAIRKDIPVKSPSEFIDLSLFDKDWFKNLKSDEGLKKIGFVHRNYGGDASYILLESQFKNMGYETESFCLGKDADGRITGVSVSDIEFSSIIEQIKCSNATIFFVNYNPEIYTQDRLETLFIAIGNRKSFVIIPETTYIKRPFINIIQSHATKICYMSENWIENEMVKNTRNATFFFTPSFIQNKVDEEEVKKLKEYLGIKTKYVVLMFCAPFPRNNVRFGLELISKYKDVTLLYLVGIWGNYPEAETFKSYSNPRFIIISGKKTDDELGKYFAIGDVAIAPYLIFDDDITSSSIAYLLGASRCVIASKRKTFLDIEKYGGIVTANLDDDFFNKVRYYLENVDARKEQQKKAREFAEKFSMKSLAEKIIEDLESTSLNQEIKIPPSTPSTPTRPSPYDKDKRLPPKIKRD